MENLIRHYIEEAVTRGESWDSDEDPNDRINMVNLIRELEAEKDQAYSERNRLVAFLCCMWPCSIEQHSDQDGEDWEDDWRNVVYIDSPRGQLSWHIHDSELPLFSHVVRNAGLEWDGHTAEEKYRRLDPRVTRNFDAAREEK